MLIIKYFSRTIGTITAINFCTFKKQDNHFMDMISALLFRESGKRYGHVISYSDLFLLYADDFLTSAKDVYPQPNLNGSSNFCLKIQKSHSKHNHI